MTCAAGWGFKMRVADRYFLIVHDSLWQLPGRDFMDIHVQNR